MVVVRGSWRAAVPVDRGAFGLVVPLEPGRRNHVYLSAIDAHDRRSPVTATTITRDLEAPRAFVDFLKPDPTGRGVIVAGRVGDRLSGVRGISVTVNGTEAEVDIGKGANGTFLARGVPIPTTAQPRLIVVATDALGNVSTHIDTTALTTTMAARGAGIPSNVPLQPGKGEPQQPFPPDRWLRLVSGDDQTSAVGTALADELVVQAWDRDGSLLANKLVTFTVTASDGILDPQGSASRTLQVFTDAMGRARTTWQLGSDAGCGNNRVTASAAGLQPEVTFFATATPGPASQVNVSHGNGQRVQAGATAPQPLRVWASDACNPVVGALVQFTVTRGAGTVNGVAQTTIPTDLAGYAEVTFVCDTTPGNQSVQASLVSVSTPPAEFTIHSVPATAPATGFAGIVLDNANRPLEDATCTLTVATVALPPVLTDSEGQFRFDNLALSGPAALEVDGRTVTQLTDTNGATVPVNPGSFPDLHFDELVVVENADNSLGMPVRLPPLDPVNQVVFDGTKAVDLTLNGIEGLQVHVAKDTRIDGTSPPAGPITLSLDQVHFDEIPMPMPDGAAPPFAWTLQPGGTTFDPPLPVTCPNLSGLAPGALANILTFDHDLGEFVIIGTGHVSDDGSVIESDPGVGLVKAGWLGFCPPYSVTGPVATRPQIVCIQAAPLSDGSLAEFAEPACPSSPTELCNSTFFDFDGVPPVFRYGALVTPTRQNVGATDWSTAVTVSIAGWNCSGCEVGFIQNLHDFRTVATYDGGGTITHAVDPSLCQPDCRILDADPGSRPWYSPQAFYSVTACDLQPGTLCGPGVAGTEVSMRDRPGDRIVLQHGTPAQDLTHVTSRREFTTWLVLKCGNNYTPFYYWRWEVEHDYDISGFSITNKTATCTTNLACAGTMDSGPGQGPVPPVLAGPIPDPSVSYLCNQTTSIYVTTCQGF